MLQHDSPLTALRNALSLGERTFRDVARVAIAHANGNASRNTYIHFDPDALERRAADLETYASTEALPLLGVPISLKDCFDLAGSITTCGSRFYAETNSPAVRNSGMANSLLRSGAIITGKTHLHPLAYGITGQNPDYGNCLQPRDALLLTGGSSSGAVASVQEGSALAAIGTDTGGSIRVPAALSGLAGYRASRQLASALGWFPDAWDGAAHLAPSFDTVGLILRDPRDLASVAQAIFAIPAGAAPSAPRIGIVQKSFMHDCEADVSLALAAWRDQFLAMGAQVEVFDATFCNGTDDIFAAIQAHEAAAIHHGNFDHFEVAIRDRLRWGSSFTHEQLTDVRGRLHSFQGSMLQLFHKFDLFMLPASPISKLLADADHTETRSRILRYTTPFSMPGLPALSLPGEIIGAPFGAGIQIAAAPGQDPMLLAFATRVGEHISR